MKVRGLLIAAVLLLGLSGLVYWSNKVQEANKDRPDPNAPPKIIDVDKDSLVRVEIRKKDQPPTVLEKGADGNWKLTAPEPLAADQNAVSSLVSTVAELESNRLIEEKAADLSPYGLSQPAVEVIAQRKEGGNIKLLIGDETPTGSYYFAKLDNDPRVFTMASWNKTSIDKTPWDLRDKRLLTFDSDKLTRVELTAKNQTVEVGKNAKNEWQIVKPRPLRADGGNVEQLVSRLRDAKMDSNMSDKERREAASKFAKAKKVSLVRVTDAAGTQELEVRKSGDDYYAKSSVVEGVYKISSYVGEGLDKGLEDLRNKKLFDFGWNEPNRIEIRDGDKHLSFEKSGEKWISAGKQMDSVSVRDLIDKLRDLSATAFPDQGFTEPLFEAKVTSDNGARVEKVLISKAGDKYFAKRENEPSIYELEASAVTDLQKAAQEVKEHQEKKEEGKNES